jgi:trehalose synthase
VAARSVQLVRDEALWKGMGERTCETVRERFLLTRYLEEYLDLFSAFEPTFRLRTYPGASFASAERSY